MNAAVRTRRRDRPSRRARRPLRPLVRVVDHEQGTQGSAVRNPARRRRARTGVDPGRKVGIPAIFDQRDSASTSASKLVLTGDRASSRAFHTVRALKLTEAAPNAGLASGPPVGPNSSDGSRSILCRRHTSRSKPSPGSMIPTGRVVAAGLPRVHHGDQTRLRVASPFTHQEPEASVGSLGEFVGHVDPRRRSSATAWPYIGGWVIEELLPFPRGRPAPAVELVAHVGNEAGTVLSSRTHPSSATARSGRLRSAQIRAWKQESQSHNQGTPPCSVRCSRGRPRRRPSGVRPTT